MIEGGNIQYDQPRLRQMRARSWRPINLYAHLPFTDGGIMNLGVSPNLALAAMLAAFPLSSVAQADSSPYLGHAANGIATLQAWYNSSTGLYDTTGWWNSANAITVLGDYSLAANTQQYASALSNTFVAAQNTNPGFINHYYDDEGWWALAWINAYDLTHNSKYLAMAESIFADIAGGWDTTTCGGGVWWSKDRTYKNAIANELFLSVAAHLANRTREPQRSQYAEWARREWNWFAASGMINPQSLINDGLNSSNPAACTNNGQATWSYNQGVILGGLAEYSMVNHDPSLLARAAKIGSAAITYLTDANGVLHDPCEPNCGADGPQFKGIFTRNLMRLYLTASRPAYFSFVHKNADSIWNNDRGANYPFGLIWSGPFDSADAARQTSALDAIIAAAVMSRDH
jgi:predicted alpha-1,6-mannanase (GH76 family)